MQLIFAQGGAHGVPVHSNAILEPKEGHVLSPLVLAGEALVRIICLNKNHAV